MITPRVVYLCAAVLLVLMAALVPVANWTQREMEPGAHRPAGCFVVLPYALPLGLGAITALVGLLPAIVTIAGAVALMLLAG